MKTSNAMKSIAFAFAAALAASEASAAALPAAADWTEPRAYTNAAGKVLLYRWAEPAKAEPGKVRYTEVPGCGHGVWTPAYSSKEALDWLFSQRKGIGAVR